MTTISDIISALDDFFPLSTQDEWDNSGLIVGHPQNQVKGILLTVDINEQRVNEAIERGCNMIIAHHPIIFHGLKRLNGQTDEQRTIETAIKHDIALCAFHTPADKSANGLSKEIGNILQLSDIHIFIPDKNNQNIGYGIVGTLQQPLQTKEFVALLSKKLKCQCIRHNNYTRNISKIAICTGSGSEFITNALNQKVDAYVTADIKYHQFQQPENQMLLADVGHYESEEICKKLFLNILTERFAEKNCKFALCMSDTCENVIKYYTE